VHRLFVAGLPEKAIAAAAWIQTSPPRQINVADHGAVFSQHFCCRIQSVFEIYRQNKIKI
jgi:hypothetical protein